MERLNATDTTSIQSQTRDLELTNTNDSYINLPDIFNGRSEE